MPAITSATLAVFALLSYDSGGGWQRAVSLAAVSGTDDQADSFISILRTGFGPVLTSRHSGTSPAGFTFTSGQQVLLGSIRTPTNLYLREGGVDLAPVATNKAINATRLGIGCVAGAPTTSAWAGTISEVIAVTNLADIEAIEAYLTAKWF